MKIALIGYGKMGKMIEQVAQTQGHEVIARLSRQTPPLIDQADVVLDFSHPSVVLQNLNLCLSLNKPLVIGTTGWDEQLTEAMQMVQQTHGSCFYAPNFSIGAYLFQSIMIYAASLFQTFPDYEICGVEYHHHQKIDQPSGTAKSLKKAILQHLPRVEDFPFSSVRFGHLPGKHTIHFGSSMDTLSFTHEAHSRHGFALGALIAAEWLLPRQGFFTMSDMIGENDS